MSAGFLGIDIGGTNTKLAILDGRGRLAAKGMIETRADQGPAALFRRVVDALPELAGSRRINGAGIGCAGLIDARRGILHSSPNLPEWSGSPILRIGRKHLGVYTCIDNDANAAAFGEYHHGGGQGSSLFVCITLGTGVGGGIVSNGQVIRGASNFAGEIGHMTINERGPRCKCGNRGCVEAYLGAERLIRRARSLLKTSPRSALARIDEKLTPQVIAREARGGDRVARAVLEEAATHLGVALASLVNLLNPDCIALGGGIAGSFDIMRKRVETVVAERAFAEAARNVTIRKARLGNNAAAIGAALIARISSKEGR